MRYFLILLMSLVLVGCNNTSENETEGVNQQIDIRNVDVQVEDLDVSLEAEVKTLSNEIFYRIEQEEENLQEETSIELSEGEAWKNFQVEVTLPEEVMDKEDPPIIVIYGKSENGETVNPNYIPVDIN